MYINQLQATADVADLTNENYFAIDGVGGSKKLPANMVALQHINPLVDDEQTIYKKVTEGAGGVVLEVAVADDSSYVGTYHLMCVKSVEVGSSTVPYVQFARLDGTTMYVATAILPNLGYDIPFWNYSKHVISLDSLPAIMTTLQTEEVGNVELLAKKKNGDIVKVDGPEIEARITAIENFLNGKNFLLADDN